MWGGYKTIKALLRECSAGSRLTSGATEAPDNGLLWAGERIDVICIPYHERGGQMLHLTDTLNTLGIHNGHESRGGQLDALHLKLHPRDLKRNTPVYLPEVFDQDHQCSL